MPTADQQPRPGATRVLVEHVAERAAVVAVVGGEIDASNAARLATGIVAAVDVAFAESARHLVVDMSAVGFCGSAGLGALVNGRRYAGGRGFDLVIVAAEHSPVRHVLTLTDLASAFTVHASLDQALAS
ncbi:STAS domain-containing protein [Actinokineospora guangxiensis]|uniref:STAS domain-containing protein n=1 Tax=Actinokineospora guangxiensis TaxID=1490288 RepID=A0ABW0EWG5_9PSEU